MKHVLLSNSPDPNLAILIKEGALNSQKLQEHYLDPIQDQLPDTVTPIGFSLLYDKKKPTKATQKEYLSKLLKGLQDMGVDTLLCCDSEYFKTLVKETKADAHYGYVKQCKLEGFEEFNVILAPNYQGLFYNPDIQQKIDLALKVLVDHTKGQYKALGEDVIHSEYYPNDYISIKKALDELHKFPVLACDTETFSLNFWETGIGTIGFAWDQHNGLAFSVDYKKTDPEKSLKIAERVMPPKKPNEDSDKYTQRLKDLAATFHGYSHKNETIRGLVREFFESYQGTVMWHNANFDMKIVVSSLWMADLLDEKGKQQGMEIMCRNFHDTKIITYLATNSTAGNHLSLKDQAHEFAGNWAQSEINDIRKIPEDELLRYNLVDCLSTMYVFNKHYPTMIQDQQENIYNTIMKPSVKVILQMELTGMPINMVKVKEARKVLENAIEVSEKALRGLPFIYTLERYLTRMAWIKDFRERKAKAKNPDKIQEKPWDEYEQKHWIDFNPGSNNQLQELLYNQLKLPVLDKTDGGQPAVGNKTLEKLVHKTTDIHVLALLDHLIKHADASKILGTFIKAFEGAVLKSDGWHYLHGNFNLGGTVSGRLSSSGPNLQNIPSTGSTWAKLVKGCFSAPEGKLFVGADFSSLEDRISALTTRDEQKLKVYTDGYDGHCLRAYAYFSEQMPDIQTVEDSTRCFVAKVGDTDICFTEGDTVKYKGHHYSGSEFYAAYCNQKL